MPKYNLQIARNNAEKIGVKVAPSTRKGKKLDVFSLDGKKLASIGSINYYDYTVTRDKQKRKNYMARFKKTLDKVNTPSYYAFKILWS